MNPSGNWQIEHSCPQCSAPVTLDETDRLLLCTFCRTKLYLSTDDHFRYVIPPPKSSGETVYVPYWRMKGLSYAMQEGGLTERFVDTTMPAVRAAGVPPSLGLRPQVMKLKFASPETEGRFLDVRTLLPDVLKNSVLSLPQILEKACGVTDIPGPSVFHSVFVGETVSLVYSPMYVENEMLCDSLLKRPVCSIRTADVQGLLAAGSSNTWQIAFIPTLCPECGWDLRGEKDALVLICSNCNCAWKCEGKEFKKAEFAVVEGQGEIAMYLPFWRMKARIDGIKLETYADLIRLGNIPKAIAPEFEEKPLDFWSPAFKINPALFLRWTRQMTISQPGEETVETLPKMRLCPVTLPISEASKSIMLAVADIAVDKRRLFPLLSRVGVTVHESLLVYHPFIESKNEFVHANMRFSLDKNALTYGVGL